MAELMAVRASRIPIHRIRLEGFGKPRIASEAETPLPSVELESTPGGNHVKLRIGDSEVIVPANTLISAVATLARNQ